MPANRHTDIQKLGHGCLFKTFDWSFGYMCSNFLLHFVQGADLDPEKYIASPLGISPTERNNVNISRPCLSNGFVQSISLLTMILSHCTEFTRLRLDQACCCIWKDTRRG
jgi:hypothetical protein